MSLGRLLLIVLVVLLVGALPSWPYSHMAGDIIRVVSLHY
jgi:hypothetical protein